MVNKHTIVTLHDVQFVFSRPGQPPAFLQCGDFVYPLIPGQSPVLHTSHKGYVFPDIDTDGGTVGVIFSSMQNDELKELNHVSVNRSCVL